MTKMEMLRAFHEKFGLGYDGSPRELPRVVSMSRVTFMLEELTEYMDAVVGLDLEKQLDALVDLAYVVMGTAYLHGFDFDEAFGRVHAANMLKVRGGEGGFKFGMTKPEGWRPPDLSDLVRSRVDDGQEEGVETSNRHGKTD